jgi:hypothetical protein
LLLAKRKSRNLEFDALVEMLEIYEQTPITVAARPAGAKVRKSRKAVV